MEKLVRIITLMICNGVGGVISGAMTGCIVGTIIGLFFGDIRGSIGLAVFIGIVIHCGVFAATAVFWDDGDSLGLFADLLGNLFAWRNAMRKPAVLFLCTNNAVRSQMAEAFLKKKASDHFDTYSAGTEPKETIHPLTIRVMSEVGINISGQRPKGLNEYLGRLPVRVAIFVCQKQVEEKCPILWPGALARLEWPFDDPAVCEGAEEDRIAKFRSVRDQIDQKITNWLTELTSM